MPDNKGDDDDEWISVTASRRRLSEHPRRLQGRRPIAIGGENVTPTAHSAFKKHPSRTSVVSDSDESDEIFSKLRHEERSKVIHDCTMLVQDCVRSLWIRRKGFLFDVARSCFECLQMTRIIDEELKPNEQTHTDTALLSTKKRVKEIVCYGLGNFSGSSSRSKTGAMQLAFILLVRQILNHSSLDDCEEFDSKESIIGRFPDDWHRCQNSQCSNHITVHFYDPCMSSLEKAVLEDEFDICVTKVNQRGKRRVTSDNYSTLFFMPHCPMRLYSNLLWANWDECILTNGNIIIIGNSMTQYGDRMSMCLGDKSNKVDDVSTNCIVPLIQFIKEMPIKVNRANKKTFHVSPSLAEFQEDTYMAFHDMSVMAFSATPTDLNYNFNAARTSSYWPDRPSEYLWPSGRECVDDAEELL